MESSILKFVKNDLGRKCHYVLAEVVSIGPMSPPLERGVNLSKKFLQAFLNLAVEVFIIFHFLILKIMDTLLRVRNKKGLKKECGRHEQPHKGNSFDQGPEI